MEKYITRKKVFDLVRQSSQMEMEELKKEEVSIKKSIVENQQQILEKQQKADAISSDMLSQASKGSLDLKLFSQYRDYLVLLQDELMRDRLISKTLDKRHKVQLAKVNEKYKEAKLYQKMIDKSDEEIQMNKLKIEEKELEALANKSGKGGLHND